MIEMSSMRREGEKNTVKEVNVYLYWNEENAVIWSTVHERCIRPITNWKNTIQPVKKNKTEELADIYCMPHSWKIPKFQPLLKISLHCQDERVREFFLNDYYIYYFLVAKSMLRPYWTKTTEYRVSSNEGPRSYHVNQAPQFYLSSLS